MFNNLLKTSIKILLFLLIVVFPIFMHLEKWPIRIWDEARNAVSAFEMFNNGNYLIPTIEGIPDFWSTKPPLLIWFQVFFMNLFGTNELAVRFPVALSAFFTCILFMWFSIKFFKNYWLGLCASLVLVTSTGYIFIHAARTGDYDALLAFFTTFYLFSFFGYCHSEEPKSKNFLLLITFLSVILAVMTKSVAGMIFIPAMVIYALFQKKAVGLFRNKNTYIGIGIFLLIIGGYYFIREKINPGYLQAVYDNEYGPRRYTTVVEGHEGDFWYYFDLFINRFFIPWYIYVPCGILIGLFSKNKLLNQLTIYLSLLIGSCFIVISSAKTKVEWYCIPLYPLLAFCVAIFLSFLVELTKDFSLRMTRHRLIFPVIILFLIGSGPYRNIINYVYMNQKWEWGDFYDIDYFLRHSIKDGRNLDGYVLSYEGYYVQHLFYLYKLKEKGQLVKMKLWTELSPGDKVIAHQPQIKDYIEKNYLFEAIGQEKSVKWYKILGN